MVYISLKSILKTKNRKINNFTTKGTTALYKLDDFFLLFLIFLINAALSVNCLSCDIS